MGLANQNKKPVSPPPKGKVQPKKNKIQVSAQAAGSSSRSI